MRVAIVGSRGVPRVRVTREILAFLRTVPADTIVVSGGAIGVDSIAEQVAKAVGLDVLIFPVTPEDWRILGRKAGPMRNALIVNAADEVHAWWDGQSRGTAHTIGLAKKAGVPVTIHSI